MKNFNTLLLQRLVVVSGLAILGLVIGWDLYSSRQELIQQEGLHILTQTRLIARNLEQQLDATNSALQGVLDDFAYLKHPANQERSNKRLRVLTQSMPGVRTIFYTDAHGKVLASSRPELIGKTYGYRDYITEPRKHPSSSTLYISSPFKSVLGVYLFNITRMIADADGKFSGVVTAGIDPAYFQELLQSTLYAPDMIATINHANGIRFMIRPYREGQVGKNIAVPGSMFTRHIQSGKPETMYRDTGYATGEHRMMAIVSQQPRQIKVDKPLCIIAGRTMAAIMRPWYDKARIFGLFYFALCTVSIVGLVWIERRQSRIQEAEKKLADAQKRFVDIFEFMPDPTLVVDHNKQVIGWNRAMEKLTGIPKAEMLGKGNNAYTIPFYGIPRENLIDLLFTDNESLKAHYQNINNTADLVVAEAFCPHLHNGNGAFVWATATPLYDSQGEVVGGIESIRDISHQKQLEADLKQSNELLASQARVDFLTGIYNRLMFSELMQAELARACRYNTPVSLIMFDLDHFKRVNDGLGHATGDHVLKETVKIIANRIRIHDVLCRWGGEEFMILAPKSDAKQATNLASILCNIIAGYDFGNSLRITASFGVTCHVCGESAETLIERVDAALYCAKNSGRNKVITH